ncbi:hypothetical protein MRQ36_19845 [Micromonospora sp. R77]|uniref:endonuclease/exonuclease/phosphatase family protein n=1 Tax=Micromonospora sp. R77 TaxID=2925836 RepID=UPI001F601927|nr:hypothetical protein [Micromonospora sp. R77]MCI4064699.1 hypothetical protein [Micromonospora sp. R77]
MTRRSASSPPPGWPTRWWRPARCRTSPADRPREQIDHVLVSPGVTATDATAPPGTASDHLPVAVTLTLP